MKQRTAKTPELKDKLEILKAAALNVPDHIKLNGWYCSGKPVFGDYYVYGDDGRGTGRQHIASIPADKQYFGALHEFIAAADPSTIIALINALPKANQKGPEQ